MVTASLRMVKTVTVVCLRLDQLHQHNTHRRLKLRTDGGQSRVHELGSIDLFVVNFWNMNQLSTDLEHKLPIMYRIFAANFFVIRYAFPILL